MHGKSRIRLLRMLRAALGLRVEDVAIQVPCDKATLARHERGEVPSDNTFAVRVIEVLGGEAYIRSLIEYLQSVLDWLRANRQPLKLA